MSYTIRYTGTRHERQLKAAQDAHEFNEKGVKLLLAEFPTMWASATGLLKRKQAVNRFHLYAEFAGLQGAPVRALMRKALNLGPWSE